MARGKPVRLPESMRIQDAGDPAALYDAFLESHIHVPGPLLSWPRFRWMLTAGTAFRLVESYAATEGGEIVGGYRLVIPLLGNTHTAELDPLFVRPAHRRRGLGTELLAHAAGRARAHGRRLLLAETPVTGPGAAFSSARGGTALIAEARRVLDLRTVNWETLGKLRPPAGGYQVELWAGPAGPELFDDLAVLMAGMNDAPHGEGIEAETYDAERVRDQESTITAGGAGSYSAIARRSSDGAPAGFTRVFVGMDHEGRWGWQADTTVLGPHRGHRLGLLLKVANLLELHEREPGIDRIITWNATSNSYMLDINRAMGFELLDEWNTWQFQL